MTIYCFDLDSTLCTPGSYEDARPYIHRIQIVNHLYDEGHTIIISTARGGTSGKDWSGFTSSQLHNWGVKYHVLHVAKPVADLYIDDRGVNDQDFFGDEKWALFAG